MKSKQKGFTLIELIVVIVILGVLAAVAAPKFTNVTTGAETAVLNGAKAAIQSAAIIQFAKNNGAKSSASTILAATDIDSKVDKSNTGCDVTLKYTGGTAADVTFTLSSDYCSG